MKNSLDIIYRQHDQDGYYVDVAGRCVGYVWHHKSGASDRQWHPVAYGDERATKEHGSFWRAGTRAEAAHTVFTLAAGFAPDGWRVGSVPLHQGVRDWMASIGRTWPPDDDRAPA